MVYYFPVLRKSNAGSSKIINYLACHSRKAKTACLIILINLEGFILSNGHTAQLLSHLIRMHVCMCVSGGCILMHALAHSQLAEYRPWRRCCSMTCTDMEMTESSVITTTFNMHLPSLSVSFWSLFIFALWLLSDYYHVLKKYIFECFLCHVLFKPLSALHVYSPATFFFLRYHCCFFAVTSLSHSLISLFVDTVAKHIKDFTKLTN